MPTQEELDAAILALLGPKTDADNEKPKKKKAPKENKPKEANPDQPKAVEAAPEVVADPYKIFPSPKDNNQVQKSLSLHQAVRFWIFYNMMYDLMRSMAPVA